MGKLGRWLQTMPWRPGVAWAVAGALWPLGAAATSGFVLRLVYWVAGGHVPLSSSWVFLAAQESLLLWAALLAGGALGFRLGGAKWREVPPLLLAAALPLIVAFGAVVGTSYLLGGWPPRLLIKALIFGGLAGAAVVPLWAWRQLNPGGKPRRAALAVVLAWALAALLGAFARSLSPVPPGLPKAKAFSRERGFGFETEPGLGSLR